MNPDTLFEQALTLQTAGQLDLAIEHYRVLLNQESRADAYANLAVALRMQGKVDAAIALYRRALLLEPTHVSALSNLGGALWLTGKPADALPVLEEAIRLQPDMASAHYNLGLVHLDMRVPEKAIACFETVMQLDPERTDAPFDRARAILQTGDLVHGFEAYESRYAYEHRLNKQFRQPHWGGKPLMEQTLLLYGEQGYGDTLQFARYIPLIEKQGGRIILECPPPLKRLMAMVSGVDQVISEGDHYPPFDLHSSLFSLPYLFKTQLDTIPTPIPYLQAPDAELSLLVPQETRLKVGIVWASGHQDTGLRKRTVGLKPFLRLLEIPGVSLYSLQKGPQANELQLSGANILIQDLAEQIEDFADTATALSQLDLLISADTAIVHLAGALGKPVWVLLPYASEWRWMNGRDDSPWYPTLRLFRQETRDDWQGVFDRVIEALATIAKTENK